MKRGIVFTVLVSILAVLGLITACDQPTNNPHACTVTFVANGGTPEPKSQTVNHGANVKEPAAMTNTGYSFGGWYMEAACVNKWDFTSTAAGNLTLYAKWNPEIYTVIFEANSGTPPPDQQNISCNDKVIEPPAMTKPGYGFGGWYTDAECVNQWNFDTDTVTANITLYALWDTNFYTVSLEANGGSPIPGEQNIAYGRKAVTPPAMTKTGFDFGGWYTEAECVNEWDFTANTVTGDITLYARWDTSYYTVIFNSDNGNPAPQQQTIAYGGEITEPAAMNKTGYTFGGWYKDAACISEWNFAADTVSDDITLYAKWNIIYYTVNFEADGGSPEPIQQIVASGNKVTEPPAMYKTGVGFDGWYTETEYINEWDFTTGIVTGNIVLYARWEPAIVVSGANLAEKIQWLNSNVQSGGNYLIEFCNDESVNPTTLSYLGKDNVTITMMGIDTNRIISLNANGSMFTVGSGVTLILDDKLELQGKSDNSSSLIYVNPGANLIMNSGARITNNTNNINHSLFSSYGGGVYVNGGIFTMNSGVISGNSASPPASVDGTAAGYGGGVYVSGGIFTMSGGVISGNIACSSAAAYGGYGGGVYVYQGIFTMYSGKITGNSSPCGGGVYVNGGFTMSGGQISGNTSSFLRADCYGGGVYVRGDFTMSGGEISGNTCLSSAPDYNSCGGGVYVYGGFTMSGGQISDNSCSCLNNYSSGGGVYVTGETFTMSDGKIFGNTCIGSSPSSHASGGGVFLYGNIVFNKSGGTIYGYSEENAESNTVMDVFGVVRQNQGHAVYSSDSKEKYIKYKDTSSLPKNNLSYNSTVSPPAWSGDWDN